MKRFLPSEDADLVVFLGESLSRAHQNTLPMETADDALGEASRRQKGMVAMDVGASGLQKSD